MSARLTVVFYIALCLQVGAILTLLPWMSPLEVIGDWGDNFFLVYAAQKADMPAIRNVFASGWVRGAVTGLGVLNFVMAFWEMAHFRQSVRALEQTQTPADSSSQAQTARTETDAYATSHSSDLLDNERRDQSRDETLQS